MTSPSFPYSSDDLDRFRDVQRLAYGIAQQVEHALRPGMTERDAARLIADAQAAAGVGQVFHDPFAWFGPRTMLGAEWAPEVETGLDLIDRAEATSPFVPGDQALTDGMPVIVDLAPVVDGYSSDIGYSCLLGRNEAFDELDAGLAEIRTFLLAGIRDDMTMLDLYKALDAFIADRGWENCHQHYPDRALGHMVLRVEPDPDRPSPIPGFGTAAAEGLIAVGTTALEQGTGGYPVWNDSEFTDFPAAPGLWAVEPHIGRDGVGAKFEELLVVTDTDAYWLDDDLPHHARWAAASHARAGAG